MTRKYNKSVGEAHSFDAAGVLRDRKLATFQDARDMIHKMQDAVPELGSSPIILRWMRRHTTRTFGTCLWQKRRITLYPMGQQEKTMIHELAHLAAPGDKHRAKFKLMAAKLERVWRDIINVHDQPEVQPVRRAEPAVATSITINGKPLWTREPSPFQPELPWVVTRYMQLRREGKLAEALQLFNNTTNKMQTLMIGAMSLERKAQ